MIKTFVWFTYWDDSGVLMRSVQSVLDMYPKANIVICDDVSTGRTLHPAVVNILQKMGAILVPTAWPRNGNLRGWKCAKEVAVALKWAQEITGADVVVKIDSDVILIDSQWIDDFATSKKAIVAGMQSRCKRAFCGATYALKREGLDVLVESFEKDMESPYDTEEDFEMASRLYRHCGGTNARMILIPFSFAGVHPSFPDAKAGIYCWAQDNSQWQTYIVFNWQQVVVGLCPNVDVKTGRRMRSRAAKQIVYAVRKRRIETDMSWLK